MHSGAAPGGTSASVTAVCDAGGTNLKGGLVGADGALLPQSRTSVPSESSGTLERIIGQLGKCLGNLMVAAEAVPARVTGIAVACPGPFDYERGAFLARHKYQAVFGIPLIPEIRKRIQLPDAPTRFYHDLHAFAAGEYMSGQGSGAKSLFCVSIGTGVGTAWVRDGSVIATADGGPKCPIYELPWEGGVLEDRVSARGVVARYAELSGKTDPVDARRVGVLAQEGDPVARRVFTELGEVLGRAIQDIIERNEVDTIVLGGQVSGSSELFVPALQDVLSGVQSLRRVYSSRDPDGSALIGGAALLAGRLPVVVSENDGE